MRTCSQLLRSRAARPLQAVEYLDLSNLHLVSLERLDLCPKLQTLVSRRNQIESLPNLACCPQLWKIDLANNKVRSLEGLIQFPAFGTLILSNNDLDWNELVKLRHIQILDLCLHGNPKLESDPYYRLHIIDSLPLVWMLDGRIITSSERAQVEQFFKDSALSDRPVRHKLSKNQFIPSCLKNIRVTGVFGQNTDHLMRRFSKEQALNVDLDKRRLHYLAYNLQENVNMEFTYKSKAKMKPPRMIETLISFRNEDKEKCNMLLLMLVASLEFAIPSILIQQTLEVATLTKLGNIKTMDLFLLPREIRSRIVSLLLSGVKIERDQHIDGGLYGRLYLGLYELVADLLRLANGDDIARYHSDRKSMDARKSSHRSLLATEVVQLLCIVPTFCDYVIREPGIIDLIRVATKDKGIGEKIKSLVWKAQSEGVGIKKVHHEVANYLLRKVKESNPTPQAVKHRKDSCQSESREQEKLPEPSYIITSKRLVRVPNRVRPYSSMAKFRLGQESDSSSVQKIRGARAATAVGVRSRDPVDRGSRVKSAKRKPALGDRVQVAHQTYGHVVALPESRVGLVQIDTVASPKFQQADYNPLSRLDNQFIYINTDTDVDWDAVTGNWKVTTSQLDLRRLTLPKKERAQSSLSADPPCRRNAEGEGGWHYLSDLIRQSLQLRVDLPVAYSDDDVPTTQFGSGRAVVTDHVRSIVRECLQEADVKWSGDVQAHDQEQRANKQAWEERSGAGEIQDPSSEVAMTADSESYQDTSILDEESKEDRSEPHQDWSAARAVEHLEPQALWDPAGRDAPDSPEYLYPDSLFEKESDDMVSSTENARIKAWKTQEAMKRASNSGVPSRVGSATSMRNSSGGELIIPPPQRPPSPSHPGVVPLRCADTWLAGGRDFNSMNIKRIPVARPGWMEGLEDCRRPRSSPSTATYRRSPGASVTGTSRTSSLTGRPLRSATRFCFPVGSPSSCAGRHQPSRVRMQRR